MNREELDLLIKNGFLQSNPDKALTTEELNNLVSQGFLEELPNHFFTFHNNLTWEVIYETLLFAERRLLHNIIAIHIEKHNSSNLEAVSDVLLYHFEKGRNYPKCVLYGAKAGDRETILFANEDALSFYKRALIALDNIKHSPRADRSLLFEHIGDVYENSGNHKEALANYRLALDTWRDIKKTTSKKPKYVPWKVKPSINEAFLMRKLAMSYEHNSEFDNAVTWLDKAEKILPLRPGRVAAQIAATRSATLYRKGDFLPAIKHGLRALKLAKKSGRKEDLAYAHNVVANSYIETGEFQKAIQHLQFSKNISYEIQDFPGIANSNYNLGNTYWHIGSLTDAAIHYKNALSADEQMHNASGITMDQYSLGSISLYIGEIDESIENLLGVYKAYESGVARRDLTGVSLGVLCKAYQLKGNLKEAENYIQKALSILGEDSQSGILVHVELQLAELFLAQGKPEEAKEKCLLISDQIKKTKAVTIEIILERILGNAYVKLHDLDHAFHHLGNSIKIASQIGSQHEEALSVIDYVKAAIESGNTGEEVRNSLSRALEILSKIGAKLDLKEAQKLAKRLSQQ